MLTMNSHRERARAQRLARSLHAEVQRAERAERARQTHARLYGHPVDIDKVWADRDALHDAEQSMIGEKP